MIELVIHNQYALPAETWRIGDEPVGGVLDRWASAWSDVSGTVAAGTVARWGSKSTGGIWSRVAHVCLRIRPNSRWYMRFLQTFRECSILLPVFAGPVRNFQKFCGCLENCRFYRESAYRGKFYPNFIQILSKFYPNFIQILIIWRTSIKQIRVLVAFILQPEMKLPKIVPDPR